MEDTRVMIKQTDHRHTHFFSTSFWPTRTATSSSVTLSVSLDTLGNLDISSVYAGPVGYNV